MLFGYCSALLDCDAARHSAFEWADVDLAVGRVNVRQTLQRRRGVGFVLVAPKTLRSRRSVLLTALAVIALREHRCRQTAKFGTPGSCSPTALAGRWTGAEQQLD